MITLTKQQLALCNQLAAGPADYIVVQPDLEADVKELENAGLLYNWQYDTGTWWASLTPTGRFMFPDAGLRRVN